MRKLDLDLLKTHRRPGWAGFALLALALAYAADVAHSYVGLKDAIAGKELRLASIAARLPSARIAAEGGVNPEEFKAARDTVQRLATPWPDLFAALEATRSDQVALLEVVPEPSGALVLTGEAKDYLGALSYVAALAEQPGFSKVRLVRHELREREPQRPLVFTVSAAWSAAR